MAKQLFVVNCYQIACRKFANCLPCMLIGIAQSLTTPVKIFVCRHLQSKRFIIEFRRFRKRGGIYILVGNTLREVLAWYKNADILSAEL
ncbi:hypothetical protein AVR78_19425 [Klebsiella quasipneumoniae]|nr:hypothetical protein AVR78_19425 [Klebsiella quasipneumoniae]EMR22334.1 hypothetical protein KP700603_08018 [Klebsiella quasipneumoniae]